jgi:hypothetical protein
MQPWLEAGVLELTEVACSMWHNWDEEGLVHERELGRPERRALAAPSSHAFK